MKTFQKAVFLLMVALLLVPFSGVMAQSVTTATPPTKAPALLDPRNGALRDELKPALLWLRVQGATRYQVQLTSAAKFDPAPEELMDVSFVPADLTQPIVHFTSDQYPTDGLDWLTPNRFYRWHVRACNGVTDADCGPWSATRAFLPRYAQTDKAQLISPANAAVLDTVSPTFEWTRLANDSRYELNILGPGNIRRIFVTPDGGGPNAVYVATFDLRGNTPFQWRVRAIGYNGLYVGPWSDTFTFTTPVVPPPTPQDKLQVKLILPRNNALRAELEPTLSWYRIPSATRYQVQLTSSNVWYPAPSELMSVNFVPTHLTNVVVNFTSANYTTPLDWLTVNRPYYWHVRACPDAVDANCYAWSNTRRYVPLYTQANRPVLVSPGSPSGAVTIDTLTPSLVWNRLPNDSVYEVVVASTTGVWHFWYTASGSDPTASFSLPHALANNKTYWWRVRAVGFHGWYAGAWSQNFYFTTPAPAPAG